MMANKNEELPPTDREKEYMSQIGHLEDRARFLEKRINQLKKGEHNRPMLVYLHGIVGAGKSTVGEGLAKMIEGAEFVPEPVEVYL